MSRDGLLGNLLKVAAVGAVVYLAYKLGEQRATQKLKVATEPLQPVKDIFYEDVVLEKSEEENVLDLIRELRNKPNKTKNDKYNIELLEIKLKQLRSKK